MPVSECTYLLKYIGTPKLKVLHNIGAPAIFDYQNTFFPILEECAKKSHFMVWPKLKACSKGKWLFQSSAGVSVSIGELIYTSVTLIRRFKGKPTCMVY